MVFFPSPPFLTSYNPLKRRPQSDDICFQFDNICFRGCVRHRGNRSPGGRQRQEVHVPPPQRVPPGPGGVPGPEQTGALHRREPGVWWWPPTPSTHYHTPKIPKNLRFFLYKGVSRLFEYPHPPKCLARTKAEINNCFGDPLVKGISISFHYFPPRTPPRR